MNDTNTRLCGHHREVTANMAQAGKNQKAIAKAIGRSNGTISKELRRNRGQRSYRPPPSRPFGPGAAGWQTVSTEGGGR